MSQAPRGSLAPHVQAAITAGAQPKTSGPRGNPAKGQALAPHVQAAITAGAQPKMPWQVENQRPSQRPAPHVQAAITAGAQAKMGSPGPDQGRQHPIAAHVRPAGAVHTAANRKAVPYRQPATPPESLQMADPLSWEKYGANQSEMHFLVPTDWETTATTGSKMNRMFDDEVAVEKPKSYKTLGEKQGLRWISSMLESKFGGLEIQCYYHTDKVIYIASNKDSVNATLAREDLPQKVLGMSMPPGKRRARHTRSYRADPRGGAPGREDVLDAFKRKDYVVVTKTYDHDHHAERRIQEHLGIKLDERMLGGIRRACGVCAVSLDLSPQAHPGPIWPSGSALGGKDFQQVKTAYKAKGWRSHVTHNPHGAHATDHDTDSEPDSDSEDT